MLNKTSHITDAEAGTTLLEMLVVLTGIAVLSLGVFFVPGPKKSTDALRFQAMHQRLSEQAVLSGQVLGLQLDRHGFQPLLRQARTWSTLSAPTSWQVAQDPSLSGILVFLPSGDHTPVELTLARAHCTATRWGPVTCQKP